MRNGFIKYVFVTWAFFSLNSINAQILTFDHGEIEFYTATAVSDIDAVTNKADVNLNVQTGQVTVLVDIKSFEFESELMQDHFNDKYMESDKFPRATLRGKVLQDISNGIDKDTTVDVSGELTIHGITNDIKFKTSLSKQGNFTIVKAKIPVVFKDYAIDDPSILTKSVAKDVEIKSTLFLK